MSNTKAPGIAENNYGATAFFILGAIQIFLHLMKPMSVIYHPAGLHKRITHLRNQKDLIEKKEESQDSNQYV